MSKSIKSTFSSVFDSNPNEAEDNLIKYYQNYDTSMADSVVSALGNEAKDLSAMLKYRPNYVYAVDASDKAQQQAIDATYNSYLNTLLPEFKTQNNDMQTTLSNQGLSVGSEAYQRAMNDLSQSQNMALADASYKSVLAGQKAYNDTLSNAIDAGEFTNEARQLAVSEIYDLLQKSLSSTDKADKIYKLQSQAGQNTSDGLDALVSSALAALKLVM